MVMYTAFGLTVSEAKIENMCSRRKGIAEPIAMFNIKAGGRVYNQTNESVYLGENINHNAHEGDPFGGICGPHEGYETAEVRDIPRAGGGRGLRGGPGKRVLSHI